MPWCRRLCEASALCLILSNAVHNVLLPLFDAAGFTSGYVRAVGQDVSPGKCVLLMHLEVYGQAGL